MKRKILIVFLCKSLLFAAGKHRTKLHIIGSRGKLKYVNIPLQTVATEMNQFSPLPGFESHMKR